MYLTKISIKILLFILLIATGLQADEWGEMRAIYWRNPPPYAYPGFFNPSYCDTDSLLYFDTFFRLVPYDIYKIYTTHFSRPWTDPVELPEPINITDFSSCTPQINASGDSLLFSSNRPGTRGGMDIWLAIKTDGIWGEPVNLGDSINTDADELAPCLANQSSILFFERYQNDSPEYDPHVIVKSNRINGVWQSAEILPEIINLYEHYNYGPFFDEQEQALYFTNVIHPQQNDQLKKALLIDGNWQEPVPLGDNVNGFLFPNYCNNVTTENACLSHDRQLLFYNKWIWEASYCIDFESILFYSERTVSIADESHEEIAVENIFDVYPNPSNSSFHLLFNDIKHGGLLEIYNVRGQLVNKIEIAPGSKSIEWHGTDLSGSSVASGIYYFKLQTDMGYKAQKAVLLK